MIRIVDKEDKQPVTKKKLYHNSDIFVEARDFYHNHEEYRSEQIAVLDDEGELKYMLAWEPNKIIYPNLSKSIVLNLYVSEFWNYEIDSPRMDFDYIKDIDTFIFETVEEYSVQATKVILKYFPEKTVCFQDKRAKWFFGDDVVITDELEKEALQVGSDLIYSIDFGHLVLEKEKANSINLMSSLYWLSDAVEYGEDNPDKVFYVIKSPIASSGLVKFLSFLLFFAAVAYEKKDKNVIPVLDTAIAGDDNQFNNGVYKDVWGMFFDPVSEYSLEEVYNSKNVIVGQEGKMGANPYLMYVEYHSNIGPLMKTYLKLNDNLNEYCKKVREKLQIPSGAKVLGVVGRGTDFNNPGVAALHTLPLSPDDIVKKSKEVFREGGYDYIFLATEDQKVFDTFMTSDLKGVTKYIEQKRYSIDPSKELLHNKYLEASESGERDGYTEAKVYISILEMLRRCNGIVASTDCGAVDYAMAMTDNELEDLYIHGHDTNEFLMNK
ncbi:MAG: hypothetical protein IJU02_07780 [Lachnospiraceae bacterium]|nr:hypothetical protein [Lachnospiraceae bacterium]